MKKLLQDLLVCPKCGDSLTVKPNRQEGANIIEGQLNCRCGMVYPIVNSIPRILSSNFENEPVTVKKAKEKTQKSFGYQWTEFSKMSNDFKKNFFNYIKPVKASFFLGKFGLDAGCGFGRHLFNAAQLGAEMVGLDMSAAIDSSYKNTKHLNNVHLVQADMYFPPIQIKSFDFIYSIGVLHHLPDPEAAFKKLLTLLKPNGAIFIWVYSKKRKITNFFLEILRKITTRMPFWLLKALCFAASIFEWIFLIQPYKLFQKLPGFKWIADKLIFPHIKLYAQYPFQVVYADWFDRLSAPIRFYYNEKELLGWFKRAGLVNIKISPTGLYGWRGYGEKKAE